MVDCMANPKEDFARYCCELLASVGPCALKRMFGGYAISTDGLTIAWVIDLGSGDTLWLKASDDTRAIYESAGCRRFTYTARGAERNVYYYSAPEDAMESPGLMAPWARQALACALQAQAAKPSAPRRPRLAQAQATSPKARRTPASRPKTAAARKSTKG
jgi:DNA transformation protein